MQKMYVDRKIEKSRLVMYCLESTFAIFGVVLLALAFAEIGFEIVPKSTRISSALTAIMFAFVFMLAEIIFRYRLPLMLHIIYFVYIFASVIVGSSFGVFRMDVPMMGEMLGWYDKITHAVLGYVLCVIAIYLSQKAKLWGKTKSGDVLLILAISMAFASLWEIFEFSVDHILPGQTMQRNSLIDTMLDMIFHFALTIVFIIQYLIEKCGKINLGIAFIEKNLQSGGRVPKKNQVLQTENLQDVATENAENVDDSENLIIESCAEAVADIAEESAETKEDVSKNTENSDVTNA